MDWLSQKCIVSIIVPVYKIKEKLLMDCVSSLVSQTYYNLEIILVDDGSPDECGKWCDQFAAKDKRIHVIHTENYGVSHARNEGIKKSKGEYLVFVDADDKLVSDAIESYFVTIEKYDVSLVLSNYQVGNNQKKTSNSITKMESRDELVKIQKSYIGGARVYGLDYTGAPWGKMIKASIVKDNNCYFNELLPRSQDNEWNFRLINYINSCIYLDKVLYCYTIDSNSAMRKFWPKAIINAEKYLSSIKEDISQQDKPEEYNEAFNNACLSKLEDVLYTNIFHRDNKQKEGDKLKILRKLVSSSPYQDALRGHRINRLNYRSLLYVTLKYKCLHLCHILVLLRDWINSIKRDRG